MPRPLLARLKADSIAEFRAAAIERFRDGKAAAARDRRTAAIYLWGYTIEMLIKAAYFQVNGFQAEQIVAMRDLRDAVRFGVSNQIIWPQQGQLHSIRAWAQTLVALRLKQPSTTYTDAAFGDEMLDRAQRLEPIWSETLRYHQNRAYPREVSQVQTATEWFLTHSLSL